MPARPGITTRAGTTRAAVPGATMVPVTHEHPGQAGPKPGEHAAGSGHASADLPATARASGITLITPPLPGPSWQARENGCTASTLTTGRDARTATCPQGTPGTGWSPSTANGAGVTAARSPPRTCRACPARDKCTRSSAGRQLTLRPRQARQAATAARAGQQTSHRQAGYASRAGAEGPMRQATHVTGTRRARYPGPARTAPGHNTAAAALSLIRPSDRHNASPPDRGHLTRLARPDLAA